MVKPPTIEEWTIDPEEDFGGTTVVRPPEIETPDPVDDTIANWRDAIREELNS